MAARKKASNTAPEPFSAPGTVRVFAHSDGRTYELQVIDCRVYEAWAGTQGGGSNTSTRNSDEEARAFARKKVQSLLKQGFDEQPSKQGRVWDGAANVVNVLRSNLNAAGVPRSDLEPLPERPQVFFFGNVSVSEWLVTRDDGCRGVLLMCKVWQSQQPAVERDAMASALLDVLAARREEIFADEKTPVRKFRLPKPVGGFTHLAVLSPAVENHLVNGRFTVSRSVFRAFPAFDCELCETDTVTLAEARCTGRGSIPYNTWDRAPHPVLDLAYLKHPDDTPEFLVFDPEELEQRLVKALPTLKVAEVHARNYRGEVRRFVAGDAPPELGELRRFFGLESGGPPRAP